VLPGGQRQYAGSYSSHRGMPGHGGNTHMHVLVAAEQRATRRTGTQGVEGRRKSADLTRSPRRFALRR
jgi:hypothetical protein